MTTPAGESWSIPALRAHFDQRFTDAEKHLDDVIERIDERHKTFEVQVEEAKKAANEWRGALQDRERLTVSRQEYDAKMKALEEKFDQAITTTNGLLSALGVEMRQGFESLRITRAEATGARASTDRMRVTILAVVAVVSTIFGIVMTLIARAVGA